MILATLAVVLALPAAAQCTWTPVWDGAYRMTALDASADGNDLWVATSWGLELYDASAFDAAGIELGFLRAEATDYPQFGREHVPFLSIVDVLMFNPIDAVADLLSRCQQVAPAKRAGARPWSLPLPIRPSAAISPRNGPPGPGFPCLQPRPGVRPPLRRSRPQFPPAFC